MGVIPEVKIKPAETKIITQPGMAGSVAVVGAFPSTTPEIFALTGIRNAAEIIGTDTTYSGVSAINHIFRRDGGASSVIGVNITTTTGSGDNVTEETTLTVDKLTGALNSLKGEKFDILFVAATLDDSGLETVKDFLAEAYDVQKPVGVVLPLSRTSVDGVSASYKTAAEIFKPVSSYGLIDQQYIVDNTVLSIVDSAAHYCGLVAGKKVDESMTMKELPDVTGVIPEYEFSDSQDGNKLVGYGLTIVRCIDRVNKKFVVVNSEQPSGLDLSVERTKDFVIRQVELESQLGAKTKLSVTAIRSALETKKQLFKDTLGIIEDLTYKVEKVSSNCVEVYLDSIVFAGILTKIDVYVTVEVE